MVSDSEIDALGTSFVASHDAVGVVPVGTGPETEFFAARGQ